MNFIKFLIFNIVVLISFSCSSYNPKVQGSNSHEYQIGAYLWFQNSGEYRALCYQAYNLARLKLDRDLEDKHNRKRAVVFDIDETVFDNSADGANQIKNQIDWNKDNFSNWVKQKKAMGIPGAKDFIEYAISKRVEIIYISNRSVSDANDTLENFKLLGIPAKIENFYFLTNTSSKESRRNEVLKKYEIGVYTKK